MRYFERRIADAKFAIENADYILIGAGAGLSDAAGIKYSGKFFTDNFGDYIVKYGFTDLYTSSFYEFNSLEEKWAYWAKHIFKVRFDLPAMKLYNELYELVSNKKYFVLTTNVEHQFWKAGFSNEKIFATQGDYGLLQCEKACHNKLYNNEEIVRKMVDNTMDFKVDFELVPKCPVCGGDMEVNLRKDSYFVEDENWHKSNRNYESFITKIKNKSVVFLELGVGYNTPAIIRFPFEQMTYNISDATLIRVNKEFYKPVAENKNKTISFNESMGDVIRGMMD